jgi:hypothetical protein
MPRMRTTVILILLAAAPALVACGGSNDNNGSAKTDPEQAQLRFARCMREHGVDMPDPKPTAGGGPDRVEFKAGAGDNRGKLEAAQKACQKYMRDAAPELSPEEEQKMRDDALAFARCMRSRGIDMPDPTFQEGGGVLIKVPGGRGGDPESNPRFQAAQKDCEKLMPKRDAAKDGEGTP